MLFEKKESNFKGDEDNDNPLQHTGMAVFLLIRHHLQQLLDNLQSVFKNRGSGSDLQISGKRQIIVLQLRIFPDELRCIQEVELKDDMGFFEINSAPFLG